MGWLLNLPQVRWDSTVIGTEYNQLVEDEKWGHLLSKAPLKPLTTPSYKYVLTTFVMQGRACVCSKLTMFLVIYT